MPGTKRLTGEESWTKIKACQLDAKSSRALKENLNVEKGNIARLELMAPYLKPKSLNPKSLKPKHSQTETFKS